MNCHYDLLRCDKCAIRKFFIEQKTSFTEDLSWGNDGRLFNPFNMFNPFKHVSYSMVTVERLVYHFWALLITLSNFRKQYLFLVFKAHSWKSETLSVDSPTYDILELHSTLVRFYHNVHYKQRRIRSYGKVE